MARRLAYHLYQGYWSALDWLFPPNCGGCGRQGARWCSNCHAQAEVIRTPVCSCCGQCQDTVGLCSRCRHSPPVYTALRSWAIFDGTVRNALHKLKYQRDVSLGEALARYLLECLLDLGWDVDTVVPVPLGLARLAERGYNQSALLARPLAMAYRTRYSPRALCRARETHSQVGLTAVQRRENVSGAFKAHRDLVAGRTILVVDDVATSGATLDACASALFEAGARQVYALTVARAILKLQTTGQTAREGQA